MLITSTGFSMASPLSFCCIRALYITSIGFSIPFPLSFFIFIIETLGRTCASIASLRVDDLVKDFLNFMLVVGVGEEKCDFLPFLAVTLVDEGNSSNSGAGGGEKSLYGE